MGYGPAPVRRKKILQHRITPEAYPGTTPTKCLACPKIIRQGDPSVAVYRPNSQKCVKRFCSGTCQEGHTKSDYRDICSFGS